MKHTIPLFVFLFLLALVIDEPKVKATIYSASWCGPCKAMQKDLETSGLFKIATDNMGDPATADVLITHKVKVRAYPTIIIYRGGKEVWRREGSLSAKALKEQMDKSR